MLSRTCTVRRTLAALAACLAVCASAALAQEATVAGTVTDSSTGRPLDGVRVDLRSDGITVVSAVSNASGRFALRAAPGTYTLTARRLDYRERTVAPLTLTPGERRQLDLALAVQAFVFNPVVVSASRTEEKTLEAPAGVTVLDRQAIEDRPALTPIDYVYSTPGVQVATTGMTQQEVVVRGFNNAASGALLVLTDYRYASVPSLRINAYNFIPLTDDDIEQIEVVRGPGSALYGPNSSNGVLQIITRSPFDSPGTSISVTGGERSLMHAQIRTAGRLGERLAVKLSGQYLRAHDWPYTDPEDLGGDTSVTYTPIERVSGELRADWRPAGQTTVTTSIGVNQAIHNVDLTPLGAAQVDDWRSSYVQTRVTSGRLFAQAFFNFSNSGSTYIIRENQPIVDKSQMLVAQVQHGALVGGAVNLTYGLDLQRTNPRTDSTITGRNEHDDAINEAGLYLQAETDVTPAVRLVAAARGDYHNRLPNPVFSPRAAIVVRTARDQSLRLTYNRAFSTPTTNDLFLDIPAGSFYPIPIDVRAVGVPKTGFHFRRDCDGGLCMRSPFTPPELGGGTAWLPLDVTLFWPLVVQIAADSGYDLSAVPPPTAADVRTVLRRLDISTEPASFLPVSDVTDIPALKPTIDNVIELGYQAVIGSRFSVGIDVYRGWKNDFVGAERAETPNAFFDPQSLADYLLQYLPADTAIPVALGAATAPVGTVVPIEARDPYTVLVTYRNFGDIRYWGAELTVGAVIVPGLSVEGNYAWVDKNSFDAVDASNNPITIPLNAPANRAAFSVQYRGESLGLNAAVRGRWVDAFPVQSGRYAGTVDAYTVIDALVGYRVPFAPNVTFTLSALNLLDEQHIEFPGTPVIRRLVTGSVRAEF